MNIHTWQNTSFKANDVTPYMIFTTVTTEAHNYTKICLNIQPTPSNFVKQNGSICVDFPSYFCMNIEENEVDLNSLGRKGFED